MKQNILLVIILLLLCLLFFFIFNNKTTSLIINGIIIIIIIIILILKIKKDLSNQKLYAEINRLDNDINSLLKLLLSYIDKNINTVKILNEKFELKINLDNFINSYKKNVKLISFENFKSDYIFKSNENYEDVLKKLIKKSKYFFELFELFNEKEILQINEKLNNVINNKNNFNNLIIEYKYYSEILKDFIDSIIKNIENTSNPLSEQVLIIKQNIKDFLVNISKWEEELTSEDKGKSFKNIISKYDWQNEKFNQLFNNIDKMHKNFKKRLETNITTIDKISTNSDQIKDIYEKIKILSINASIESARADKYGKGFKVVSNEIKKLSEETQNFVGIIMNLINEAKNSSRETIKDFEKESKELTKIINIQMDEFKIFYDLLKNYYDSFNSIFLFVTKLTDNIDLHINKFNPIFQLHDISIQELENINLIISKFQNDNTGELDNIISNTDKEIIDKILYELISFIEKKVTTNIEIDTINKIIKKYGIKKEIKIDNKIDFF